MPQAAEQRFRKSLSRYATALSSIVIFVIGALLASREKHVAFNHILSAIGLSLISSTAFALFISLINNRVQDKILFARIEEQFSTLTSAVVNEVAEANGYMPIGHYSASNELDPVFNQAITQSFHQSTFYAFRGTSAKYVPARLQHARDQAPELVRIIMLDVKSSNAVRRRANDRKQQKDARGKTDDQLINEVIDETMMSLVALYDCRHLCTIDVALNPASGLTRVEMFDDSVYISWYKNPAITRFKFPETVQFPARSYMYEYQRLELTRRMDIIGEKFTFNSNSDEADLLDILTNVLGRRVSGDEVAQWRVSYEPTLASFINQISGMNP